MNHGRAKETEMSDAGSCDEGGGTRGHTTAQDGGTRGHKTARESAKGASENNAVTGK